MPFLLPNPYHHICQAPSHALILYPNHQHPAFCLYESIPSYFFFCCSFCFIFILKFLLFILHITSSSHSFPFSCPISSLPIPHPLLRGVRPSLASQRGLAYQLEAGPSPSCHQVWTRYPTIGNGLRKTISCTWDRSWCHFQGSPPPTDQAT